MTRLTVHASLWTVGGGVLVAIWLTFAVVLAGAYVTPSVSGALRTLLWVLWALVSGYLLEAQSEHFALERGTLAFDSLFRRKRHVPLMDIERILLVYEGFNQERGTMSLLVDDGGDEAQRFALGPLWRRAHLEAFLMQVELELGRAKLVKNVR